MRKNSKEITLQEKRLLYYIYRYKEANPYSPDIREMAESLFGARDEKPLSTSVVNYYLDNLERRGLISFLYLQRKGKKHNYRAARTVHLTDKGKKYVFNKFTQVKFN